MEIEIRIDWALRGQSLTPICNLNLLRSYQLPNVCGNGTGWLGQAEYPITSFYFCKG